MTQHNVLSEAEMRALPDLLLARIRAVLGAKLAGFYVVGSLVTGDFDYRSSDIDLIAVTTTELDDAEVGRLAALHADLIRENPLRDNRIEVIYVPAARLKGDRADYTFPITSPGEPFHIRDIHHDEWTINWLVLREQSITLYGADPKTLVDPIPRAKIVRVVQDLSRQTPEWLDPAASLGGLGYVILTLCRGLRLVRTGEFVSKKQAALWAAAQLPEWAWLIEKTLVWRVVGSEHPETPEAVFPDVQRLVLFLVEQIG